MPSKALTPDLLPSPEPSPSPEPPPSVELPGLRLIKVPDAAPPYDCEIHGAACAAAYDAADVGPHDADPSPESAGPRQAAAPGREAARVRGTPTGAAREASPGGAGAADMWPRQLAQVIVEILAGSRSPRQLIPLTTDRVRAQIGLLARSLGGDQRPRIKRVVTFRPAAGVLEMTVVVSFGPRSRALAMRFEHRPGRPAAPGLPARPARWLCTDLEAG